MKEFPREGLNQGRRGSRKAEMKGKSLTRVSSQQPSINQSLHSSISHLFFLSSHRLLKIILFPTYFFTILWSFPLTVHTLPFVSDFILGSCSQEIGLEETDHSLSLIHKCFDPKVLGSRKPGLGLSQLGSARLDSCQLLLQFCGPHISNSPFLVYLDLLPMVN